ncbi:hypothetical protein [Shewanella dokdonensis]|uniref:hypothetical protein n=1 Tax=Shewanella dokdonensis TaxID=712036 RepID=UPI00200E144C|nr:hypothetical protein [Shewanella dokdonensis]MCL1075487.1 hypothetical protein [Shewanella dokdonensis]
MSFKLNMDGDLWEGFCERMLRYEFGWKNFTSVPHYDRGDHGIEFFTNCGVIFQCYYPDPNYSMADYKNHVKKKITTDLGKLKKYELDIQDMLGEVKISTWILLIPFIKSRDLLKFCKIKEKQIPTLSFSSPTGITVKIETDDTFPKGSLFSRTYIGEEINIPIQEIQAESTDVWKENNNYFFDNLCRKTAKITDANLDSVRTELIKKYIQIEDLMDAYRDQFPDLYTEITNIALVNLDELRNQNLFIKEEPRKIMISLLEKNRKTFKEIEKTISGANIELFSSGFIAQWLAQCKMDFILDD